jgi:hypothetical protein
MWRKRVQEEKKNESGFAEGRFKCSMQRQINNKKFLKINYKPIK